MVHNVTARKPKHEVLWDEVVRLRKDTSPAANQRCVMLCRRILKSIHRSTHPKVWATATLELAADLPDRPTTEGERIRLYKSLLSVKVMKTEWCRLVRLLLGNAYRLRIHGDRSYNQKQAIHYLQAALRLPRVKDEKDLMAWSSAQYQLGIVYTDRLRGRANTNLQRALYHLEQAQAVSTRSRYPEQWAIIQNYYGRALLVCPWLSEERRRLLSIRSVQRALQVWTHQKNPGSWVEGQQNLALNYYRLFFARRRSRPRHHMRPADMEAAYQHIQNALGVYRRGLGSVRVLRDAEELDGWILKVLHSPAFKKLKRRRLKKRR